jgi:hypothetical protein
LIPNPPKYAGGGFAPIEAYAWHQKLMARRGAEYDQRVRTRIERAATHADDVETEAPPPRVSKPGARTAPRHRVERS